MTTTKAPTTSGPPSTTEKVSTTVVTISPETTTKEISTVTSTAGPSTTPEECAEDLDDYDKVTVSRENSDSSSLVTPDQWWKPDSPPESTETPHEGSYLTVTFDPRSKVTSVIVTNEEGVPDEEVTIAFEFQPSDRAQYLPLADEANSNIFIGKTDTKISLPSSLPFITRLRVYLVKPNPDASYKIVFNGCEETGNSNLQANF